jgi:predicted transcriptional regulator
MSKEHRVAARVPQQLRNRLTRAIAKTNQSESAIVRAALEEFFVNHPTAADKIAAIVAGHMRGIAK